MQVGGVFGILGKSWGNPCGKVAVFGGEILEVSRGWSAEGVDRFDRFEALPCHPLQIFKVERKLIIFVVCPICINTFMSIGGGWVVMLCLCCNDCGGCNCCGVFALPSFAVSDTLPPVLLVARVVGHRVTDESTYYIL